MLLRKFKIKRLTKKLKAMQLARVHNQPKDEVLQKEINYYHELASLYRRLIGNKKYPFAFDMVIVCLRAASHLDDMAAQYELAKILLEEGKFREKLQEEGLFASAVNEREMKNCYEEALIYLQAAEKLGHIFAKRMRGLCYINGWGVSANKEKGFELVVESIEQENSWDKIPEIFAAIGLNKPEFFAAIMQRRKVT